MNRCIACWLFVVTQLILCSGVQAAIIKLGFSTDSKPDIEVIAGVLSTVEDVSVGTPGDQNTEVTLLGPLAGQATIEGDRQSFSLENVVLDGKPVAIGGTLLQPTSGGTFTLYGPSNELLLKGTLGAGTLSGPLGGTATGGFLTTEFGTFTDGSLLPFLQSQSLSRSSVSISLTDVNEGTGLQLTADGFLAEFAADATASISAQEPVPEPHGFVLGLSGLAAAILGLRHLV